MFVTVTFSSLPVVAVLSSPPTTTSLVADKLPLPTFVPSTVKEMFPAVPLNPPNLAEKEVNFTPEGKVMVKVIVFAGLSEEPNRPQSGCCGKDVVPAVTIFQELFKLSFPVTFALLIFKLFVPNLIVPVFVSPQTKLPPPMSRSSRSIRLFRVNCFIMRLFKLLICFVIRIGSSSVDVQHLPQDILR